MKPTSLTRQLLIAIGLPILAVILLIGGIAYFSAEDEISEVYDSQMITSANILWSLSKDKTDLSQISIRSENLGLDDDDQKALDEYAGWRNFRLWRGGRLLIASANAPADPAQGQGFSEVTDHGARWRVFTMTVPQEGVVVEVREKMQARGVVIWRIIWGLLLPMLIALPVITFIIWQGIRWGLRDLGRFASAIQSRSPDDLSPVASATTPAEVRPLAESVNQLLEKLRRSLDQERLFSDNAAHELRTPLAALSIQADVVLNAKTARERQQSVTELAKGVRRAARLLDQLLTLARLRHAPMETAPVGLYDLARDAIKALYPQAHGKNIELSLSGDETACVQSKSALLSVLVSNLLDNAVKYSPPGSRVDVAVSATGLTICDGGAGIPEAEREAVFSRFYRLKGTVEPGSGLGLSIVRGVADMLGARVRLFTPVNGVGLGVEVRFATEPTA